MRKYGNYFKQSGMRRAGERIFSAEHQKAETSGRSPACGKSMKKANKARMRRPAGWWAS